jgi:DNA polymerase III epsilon subunit-like protein
MLEPGAVPVGPFRFIALDVETACSDVASICQIGIACVRPDDGIESWVCYVNPKVRFSSFNTQLHGIGEAHVRAAPEFVRAIGALEPLLSRHLIIQHSGFDRRAIHGAYAAQGLPEPGWRWGDSVRIARRAWPEFIGNGGHGLSHLKQKLRLEFNHHDAGEDARAAALVVLNAERRTGLEVRTLLGLGA